MKLQYLLRNVGEDSVEVSTGGIVEVRNVEQNFAAAPDPALLPQLSDLLGRYTQVAGVPDALENLAKLAAEPIKIFDNKFSQTPESVADIADSVRDLRDLKSAAEDTIPLVLLIAGIVVALVGFGLFLFWPKRPKSDVGPGTTPDPATPLAEGPGQDGSMVPPTTAGGPPP